MNTDNFDAAMHGALPHAVRSERREPQMPPTREEFRQLQTAALNLAQRVVTLEAENEARRLALESQARTQAGMETRLAQVEKIWLESAA